jgi:50S ribosomal subunit-associated GTPase HflX
MTDEDLKRYGDYLLLEEFLTPEQQEAIYEMAKQEVLDRLAL